MSTILVVDDEPDIQTTLDVVLSLEGYEVITASNGAEGLRRIGEERPDLVISDMTMPGLDGLEMCGRLRRDPETRDIPIILTSSREPDPQPEQNWDVFLRKPAEVSLLLNEIKRLLMRRRTSAARRSPT